MRSSRAAYSSQISALLSVEPPSTSTISRSVKVWLTRLSRHCLIYSSLLKTGTIMEIFMCSIPGRSSLFCGKKRRNPAIIYITYFDPLPVNTTTTVLRRILISSPMLQLSIYSRSSLTTSSKSVISLLPLTCQRPVSPGVMDSLRR